MKRFLYIMILVLFVQGSFPVFAEDFDIFINLSAPETEKQASSLKKTFFIREVTDARTFAEPSAKPDIPSWGTANEKDRTEERRSKSVARASRRGEKPSGNVLIVLGDVRTIMKDATAYSLKALGYSVLENGGEEQADAVPVDVEIKNFWGHFREAFMGGSMSATIEAAISFTLGDVRKTRTIHVEAKMSARYPNKPANWEEVFTTALGYFNDAAMNELRQALE